MVGRRHVGSAMGDAVVAEGMDIDLSVSFPSDCAHWVP
jgi:hypothetical protein